MPENGFTPTEKRLLEVLRDGEPHAVKQLLTLLWDAEGALIDPDAARSSLQNHISRLRRRYCRLKGLDIVCQVTHRRHYTYRLVRLVSRDDE